MTDPSSESVYIGSPLPKEPVAAAAGFFFVLLRVPALMYSPVPWHFPLPPRPDRQKEKKMTGVPVIFFFASSI